MINRTLNRRTMLAGSMILGASSLAAPRMAFANAPGERNLLFVLLRGAYMERRARTTFESVEATVLTLKCSVMWIEL